MASAAAQRTASALGGVAWSYLGAQYRGDWVRASTILATFQQLWNSHKDAVLSYFPDPANIPMALPINGQFTAETRTAMMATLMVLADFFPQGRGWSNATITDTMPATAGGLGNWWWNSLVVPYAPPTSSAETAQWLWEFDKAGRFADAQNAGLEVRTLFEQASLGIVPNTTGGNALQNAGMFPLDLTTIANQVPGAQGAGNVTAPAPVNDLSTVLPSEVITASAPWYREPWVTWVAAAAGLTAAATFGVMIWRKNQRRPRRTR